MINWQLSKQGIRWPVSLDRIAGSGVDPSRSSIFEVIRWQVTSLQMMAGSSLIFLLFIWNMLCFCAAKLKFWFQTDLGRKNSASYYRQGRQLKCFWLYSPWSRSTSNFYALIGQSLTGELMRKIYATSWMTEFCVNNYFLTANGKKTFQRIFSFSKLQRVVYYQCCVLIGWATTRLCVIAH